MNENDFYFLQLLQLLLSTPLHLDTSSCADFNKLSARDIQTIQTFNRPASSFKTHCLNIDVEYIIQLETWDQPKSTFEVFMYIGASEIWNKMKSGTF